MTTVAAYDALCKRIIEGSLRCLSEDLDLLKKRFTSDVQSNRRLEQIASVGDLISVLKKRDLIDISRLKAIAGPLNLLSVFNDNTASIVPVNRAQVLPAISATAKERVYDLIATSIGWKWMELSRALGIIEGHIDELEQRYRSISDRMREVLAHYEQVCDQRKWKSGLLEALGTARRNDLRKQAQEIFDTH